MALSKTQKYNLASSLCVSSINTIIARIKNEQIFSSAEVKEMSDWLKEIDLLISKKDGFIPKEVMAKINSTQ